ncbi:MAG: SDR family NAD(P)-dependent oxidoreductase [Microbacteriaceae bacterium]
MNWLPSRLPAQNGRTFVVTGGNAGLGYFTAEQLASTGAHVVIASRDGGRAERALRSIRARVSAASVESIELDLTDSASIARAAERIGEMPRLDGLVLNAGTTAGSNTRQTTAEGHELTLATNFLGHFALTASVWAALSATEGSRVVGLGSLSTLLVSAELDDLQTERGFSFFRAYGRSKHAIHGFVLELDRRAREAGVDVTGVLAHPGYAIDGLSPERPGISGYGSLQRAGSAVIAFGTQGKNRGAAPTVRALLDTTVRGGELIGPAYLTRGRPTRQLPVSSSADPEFGAVLWGLAEEWTGVPFGL